MLRRWGARVPFGLGVMLALVVLVLLVAPRSAYVRELVRQRVLAALGALSDADVRIGAIRGPLLHTLVLDDLRVAVEGRTIVRVPRVEIAYALLPLLRGTLRVDRILLARPRVRAIRTAEGWRMPHARPSGGGSSLGVLVRKLVIEDGRIAVAMLDATPPRRFAATALALDASARLDRRARRVRVAALRFVPRGLALSAVEATAAVNADPGAPLRLERFTLATARSRIAASAVVDRGRALAARLDLTPLAGADVRAVAARPLLATDVRLRARTRGPWRAIRTVARADLGAAGTVAAATLVDAGAEAPGWSLRLDVDRLDPGAALAIAPRATVSGRLEANGAGTDAKGPLAYRVDLHDSVIAGRALDRLAMKGGASGGRHRLHGHAEAPIGNARFAGHVGLGTTPAYAASARWTLARLDLVTRSAWGWATGRLRMSGRGSDPERRRAVAALALGGASLDGLPVDGGAVRARVAGGRVRLARLTLDGRDLGLRVEASGSADLTARRASLETKAEVDLGAVGAYLGRPMAGRARASATADGPLDALTLGADATVDELAYAVLSAGRTAARVDLRGVGGADAGGTVALRAAALRLRSGQRYDGSVDVAWRRRAGEDRADVRLAGRGENGRVQELAVTLARSGTRTRGTLTAATLSPPAGDPWRLVRPADFVVDGGFSTAGLALAAGAQRVTLAGRIATQGTSDATLRLERVQLEPFCALAGGPKCAGEVSAAAGVTGEATAPAARLGVRAEGLQVAEIAYGVLALDARYAERVAHAHAALRHPQAGELLVDGDVPVDLAWAGTRRDLSDAPLTVTARADHLDLTILRALAPRTLRSSAGRLRLDVRVTGSRAAPNLAGELAVDAGRLEVAAAGLPYENITVRVGARGTHVDLRELRASAGDGSVSCSGGADVAPHGAGTLDVRAHFDRFLALRRSDVDAELSGDVAVRGPITGPNVGGRLEVDRAVVHPAELPGSGPAVVRDPTIQVVGAPVAPGEEKAASAAGLASGAMTMSVTVAIARNAWIRRTDADIEIGGEVAIEKAAGEPVRIVGEIRLLRGWYVFQGRRFTLEEGTITFTGPTPPDPSFDLTASYKRSDYRIEIHVTGSAKKPSLSMSSDPPLEQADILSVVLFGKPSSQLGKGQSVALQQQALGLAAGYAIPELRASVMDALGLDALDVEMPEGQGPGRVSAGRYVAEDVFVSLGQEFGRRAAQVVGVEYSITTNVSVRGSTTTRGDSAVDLFWRHRY